MEEQFDQAFWDERYRAQPMLWSGKANRQLVAETSMLEPGNALDVGAGEGADAIWLAERGWTVTAVDISPVALERGAAEAARRGANVAARIIWEQRDALAWSPPRGRYDLVSAQYVQLPTAQQRAFVDRLAAAVTSGGTLLVVGHHPLDRAAMPHHRPAELFFTADDVAGRLDLASWTIVTSAALSRPGKDPEGHEVLLHDAVLRAERRPA